MAWPLPGIPDLALAHRRIFVICFLAFVLASFLLLPFLGRNFFPAVDSGQILMHARTQVGTRVEESANQFAEIRKAIHKIIPPHEIEVIVDNIGLPPSSINLTYNNTGVMGAQDGDIQIALKEGHQPTDGYVRKLREELPRQFPGVTFSFPPADIVSQILNFGSPAPIELQIRGNNLDANFDYANLLLPKIRAITGVADVRIQQSRGSRSLMSMSIVHARNRSASPCRTLPQRLVANLAGSSQVAPTFWLNPQNGVQYPIVIQTPQYRARYARRACRTCRSGGSAGNPQVLGALPTSHAPRGNALVSQYDIQPMVQIYATTQGRDLGAVAVELRRILDDTASQTCRKGRPSHCWARYAPWRAHFRVCCSACLVQSCLSTC